MKAYLIATGSELLRGKVNLDPSLVSRELVLHGIDPIRVVTLPDDVQTLKDELDRAFQSADLVFTFGGLGPTHDDLTKQVLADYFGAPIRFDEAYFEWIKPRLLRSGRTDLEKYRGFAELPEGFHLLMNPRGLAPGLLREVSDGKFLVALPGPPQEVLGILRGELQSYLHQWGQGGRSWTVLHVFGLTEPEVSHLLQSQDASFLEGVSMIPDVDGIHLYVPKEPADRLQRIREVLGHHLYGEGHETLEYVIGRLLRERQWTVATAESLTGGLVGHLITQVHGSSDYYQGGVVTYSDFAKRQQLGVRNQDLLQYGAVSEPVAQQMAEGVRRKFETDVGLSTTGIAGPTGGTPLKPVGLVYLGLSIQGKTQVFRRVFSGTREDVKYRAAYTLLDLLRRSLLDLD